MAKPARQSIYNSGYRDWFEPYLYKERQNIAIFILDYETQSLWQDTQDYYDEFENQNGKIKSKRINGIQIYFLDENHQKRRAFLQHSPYFYVLLEDGLSKTEINRIMAQIKEIGEQRVIDTEACYHYDAARLTFLEKRLFIKVIVNHPGSVPDLRSKCEKLAGVVEWREADVLFHHRCAIDHNIRVGTWYQADIRGNEIKNIHIIHNKAPPNLKVLAYDIETVFEQTREPNPNRDEISMICMFSGEENTLLVNSSVVNVEKIRDFDILLKQSDNNHSKPWVDWIYSTSSYDFSSVIEHYFVSVVILGTEKELLTNFYTKIRDYRPDVLADFFGGRFDIPFIAVRSEKYNISLEKETGFRIVFKNQGRKQKIERDDLNKNYTPASLDYVEGAGIIHLDAWFFNEKYSYLPKKDLALKPSVEKKLRIIPIGREALYSINEKPEEAVAYAGCDGYITWKYVKELVIEFFLSLGQMFPVPSSELLSRRAGSLDDLLIDAENHKNGIIGKKKIKTPNISSFSDKISIDSLAYTGGLVEAKRPGIYRSDIYYEYKANKDALEGLKDTIKTVIIKESNSLNRRIIKEEYEKRIIDELGGVKIDKIDDPVTFLKNIEIIFTKNGLAKKELEQKVNRIRNIIEESSAIHIDHVDEVIEDILAKIDLLSHLNGSTQLKGMHVDVTSMYPSQIRQYKLQPSGIVPLTMCRTCELYEADNSCYFEGDWVIKLTCRRPCNFKEKGSNKCDPSVCTSNNELKCKRYEPLTNGVGNSQEIFTFDTKQTEAFQLRNNGNLEKVPIEQTYLGKSTEFDPYASVQRWLRNSIDATQLTTKLDNNYFDIFEDQPSNFKLPPNTFMSIDARTKKITILLSVSSRVCQKSYNFVARIMDDFFNTRVRHKLEAQRLKQLISQKKKDKQKVSAELLRQQKFHDSAQLGMKVPLNSIYGLLGMKAGVRNASTPCAGITTKLSADLIHWAANELEKVGLVTELDTDGIWLWVPKLFPLTFPVTIVNPYQRNGSKIIHVTLIDKILNEKVDGITRNNNYWYNDGKEITRASKSLIQFEQDGPYDFQFVMGKKKYIVYNYDEKSKEWLEKELTGLESKRADFSKLQKYFQERIIGAYLEDFNSENPIKLDQLYQNAIRTSELIRTEMFEGNLDPSYFVKPKALNKPLGAYKSKLPQVSAAKILKDLGFSVEPGTRIEMLNIKGNHVIPRQIFDFTFKKIKQVLVKHAICTLGFMVGDLSTKEDLRKLLDVKQYESGIFGPGRIYDRMVRYPMEIQQIISSMQQELDIGLIEHQISEPEKKHEVEHLLVSSELMEDQEIISVKEKPKKFKKTKNDSELKKRRVSSKHKKPSIRGLDALFQDIKDPITSYQIKTNDKEKKERIKENKFTKKKKPTIKSKKMKEEQIKSLPGDILESTLEETGEKAFVTSDELFELESQNIFHNGSGNGNGDYETSLEAEVEKRIVCSECGALVDPEEITDEGCRFCGGNIIII